MKILFSIQLMLVLLGYAQPAMAYIDPGSGSMVLQVIMAGILGGLFAVKVFWIRIKVAFIKIFGKKNQPPKNAD